MTSNKALAPWIFCVCAFFGGCDAQGSEPGAVMELAEQRYDTGKLIQYHLPKALREISGLALAVSGELLTHNDERAVIYRVDHTKGRILGSFRLGRDPVRDDFEGIAVSGQRVFLITSTGSLYETRHPLFDDEHETDLIVTYQRYQVGLPCEIEGLATYSPGRLLAVCKQLRDGNDVLRIYAWDMTANQYEPEPFLSLNADAFKGQVQNLKKLRPAGITVTDTGGLLIVGRHGKKPALIEIDSDMKVVSLQEFPDRSRHRQPEGITLTRDQWLVIADEGAKNDNGKNTKGRMGVYRPD